MMLVMQGKLRLIKQRIIHQILYNALAVFSLISFKEEDVYFNVLVSVYHVHDLYLLD